MKELHSCEVLFGEESTHVLNSTTQIPDELYNKLILECSDGTPFEKCPSYNELCKYKSVGGNIEDEVEYWEDAPEREDFESDEEYEEALEEYNNDKEEFYDSFTFAYAFDEDISICPRLTKKYKGTFVNSSEVELVYYEDELYDDVRVMLNCTIDDNGNLISVDSVYAEIITSVSIKYTNMAAIYVPYEKVERAFEKYLKELDNI